jgi:hypothetical protein
MKDTEDVERLAVELLEKISGVGLGSGNSFMEIQRREHVAKMQPILAKALSQAHAAGRAEMREEVEQAATVLFKTITITDGGDVVHGGIHHRIGSPCGICGWIERSLPTAKSAKAGVLDQEQTAHCICPGCYAEIPISWAGGLCQPCGTEDCEHPEPKPGGEALPLGHAYSGDRDKLGRCGHWIETATPFGGDFCGQPASAHEAGGEK